MTDLNQLAGRACRMSIKLTTWLPRRLLLTARSSVWRNVGRGLVMQIDPTKGMDRGFYLRTYDTRLTSFLRGLLSSGDAAIDVGAHKGYVSLLLARSVGPGGYVWSFEPDPRARAAAEQHARRNGLDQLTLLPWALGERAEDRTFYLSKQLGWSSAFPNELARQELMNTVTLPFRSLDELVSAGDVTIPPGRLRFLKLDCEGSEELALRGMRQLLSRESPALWMEINHGSLAAAGTHAVQLAHVLAEFGYRLYRAEWHTPLIGAKGLKLRPVTDVAQEPGDVFDVIALKNGTPSRIRAMKNDGTLLLELGWPTLTW
jgi:FkbM family methyltransferase